MEAICSKFRQTWQKQDKVLSGQNNGVLFIIIVPKTINLLQIKRKVGVRKGWLVMPGVKSTVWFIHTGRKFPTLVFVEEQLHLTSFTLSKWRLSPRALLSMSPFSKHNKPLIHHQHHGGGGGQMVVHSCNWMKHKKPIRLDPEHIERANSWPPAQPHMSRVKVPLQAMGKS